MDAAMSVHRAPRVSDIEVRICSSRARSCATIASSVTSSVFPACFRSSSKRLSATMSPWSRDMAEVSAVAYLSRSTTQFEGYGDRIHRASRLSSSAASIAYTRCCSCRLPLSR